MTLSEADTRAKLIDPAITGAGWLEAAIRREVRVTNGRLFMVGEEAQQAPPLFADYVLYADATPIAVVEAKDEGKHHAAGLQQAKQYAQMLDLRYAFSSNGKQFVQFDYNSNQEQDLAMDAFPSPSALAAGLPPASTLLSGDPAGYPYNLDPGFGPRYYQDVAIRRTISAIGQGQDKLLLALATGTGKTYIASQLVWKLRETSNIRRVLFLADRVFIRDQAFNAFGFFSGPTGDPRYVLDGKVSLNYDLYFGIYQGLFADKDGKPLYQHLPPDFFDMVIIDECHRSGFGTWREILDHFAGATQIGLTATPRRTDNVDTYAYFGDPVYSYSLGQGIQDGFLATYKVHRVTTSLDDAGGVSVADAVTAGADLFVPEGSEDDLKDFYSVGEFERKITLPDWTDCICDHLASTLDLNDPMERTIVFCVNMDHALEVRQRLQNHFAHLGHDDYAVRIVSEEHQAQALLEQFRDSYKNTPVVATTVDLLSTGVDIPSVKNIVFMKPVSSVVVFKQIVGRGTRLDAARGKKWFRIIDYVNASRLFDEWDRPVEDLGGDLPPLPWEGTIRLEVIDRDTAARVLGCSGTVIVTPNDQRPFVAVGGEMVASGLPATTVNVHLSAPGYQSRTVRLLASAPPAELSVVELRTVEDTSERIVLQGVQVDIARETVLTIDATGQQLTVDQYIDYARGVIHEAVNSREKLREVWTSASARSDFMDKLEAVGVHPKLLAELQHLADADAFDVLAHIAFNDPLVTRAERVVAFLNHRSNWFEEFAPGQREIVLELLETYREGGVDELRRDVLTLDRFKRHGGVVGVVKALGGSKQLDDVLGQLQSGLYAVPEAA